MSIYTYTYYIYMYIYICKTQHLEKEIHNLRARGAVTNENHIHRAVAHALVRSHLQICCCTMYMYMYMCMLNIYTYI